jgi:hypothetical protein
MTDNADFATYREFWPHYLSQHTRNATRLLHVAGTILAFGAIIKAVILFSLFWLLMAPIIGYGIAWIAHSFVEKNHPATFTYPLWSLRGDLQMSWLWVTGRLEDELIKYNISTTT